MGYTKLLLTLGVCVLMAGCAFMMPETTAKQSAKPYVKPLFAAVQAFHREHGRYPKDQAELRESPHGKNLVFDKPGYVTMLTYQLIDANTYRVHYDSGTCYTNYVNGAITHARCNVFK